jgi:hypothetical protein
MSHRLGLILTLILLVFIAQNTMAAQTLPPAIQWIPQDAVVSLELSQPKALLELFAGEKATAAITALPLYQKQASTPKFKEFLNLIHHMEITLDTDWRTGLAKLTGGGITFAICPEDMLILIIEAEDEDTLHKLHEILLDMARSEAEKQSQPNQVESTETDYEGVTAWTFNGEESHGIACDHRKAARFRQPSRRAQSRPRTSRQHRGHEPNIEQHIPGCKAGSKA